MLKLGKVSKVTKGPIMELEIDMVGLFNPT